MNFYHLKKYFADIATILCVAILLAASPISHTNILQPQKAEAITAIDPSDIFFDAVSAVETTAQTWFQAASAFFADQEWLKEWVLDPLFWSLANALISQFIRSITAWVNSGFQGSPLFITNMDIFLAQVVDEAIGRYIEEIGGGFLCSPFELDLQIAIAIDYFGAEEYEPACTLTDIVGNIQNFVNGTFTQGGWPAWFELTQGVHNDPNRSYLELRAKARNIALKTEDDEREIVIGNNWFRNVQVCEEGVSFSGTINNCTNTTPGVLAQEQLNKALGLPQDRLVFADEFNELIAAVLSQITTQVLTGVGGLLGAGGNAAYAFYDDDGRTVIEQLLLSDEGGGAYGRDVFERSIDSIEDYIEIQEDTISFVNGEVRFIQNLAAQYPGCFRYSARGEFSNRSIRSILDEFIDARTKAREEIPIAEDLIVEVERIADLYDDAESEEEKIQIITAFTEFESQQINSRTRTNAIARANLDGQYPFLADDMRNTANDEARRCQIQFDRTGGPARTGTTTNDSNSNSIRWLRHDYNRIFLVRKVYSSCSFCLSV